MNEKLCRRVRWGITKDDKYFGMFAVHPVEDWKDDSWRRFYFFEKEDAISFAKLLDKSCHRMPDAETI